MAGDAAAEKPKEKERPPGMSNADWVADCTRRERERKAKERNADLVVEAEAPNGPPRKTSASPKLGRS